MPNVGRWFLAITAVLLALAPPAALYRYEYVEAKRFHIVTPGRFYRSGQMTAPGLNATIERYKIKTIINLQNEEPDPLLADHWLGKGKIPESELCEKLGVKYVLLTPDILPPDNTLDSIPPVVDDYLKLLDDEANYPVLLHCKAGLHRTGRLTAIYRMEYLGWSPGEALREARANNYGYLMASRGDDYVVQFIENYVPRGKRKPPLVQAPPPHPPGNADLGSANGEAP
jgi:protein tyrosine/serine phosphatase